MDDPIGNQVPAHRYKEKSRTFPTALLVKALYPLQEVVDHLVDLGLLRGRQVSCNDQDSSSFKMEDASTGEKTKEVRVLQKMEEVCTEVA